MGLVEVTVSVSGDTGIEKMLQNLKQLDGTKVQAGVFGGFAAKKAMWNEYGTSRGIPARPFLRNTLYENSGKFAQFATPFLSDIINGGSVNALVAGLGEFMQSSIRQTIAAGNFAPLAPETIARKGHSHPLIDTGDMYASIDWRRG